MVKVKDFLRRPRYLRAIPSLMILTTEMAWRVVSQPNAPQTISKKTSPARVHDASTYNDGSENFLRHFKGI